MDSSNVEAQIDLFLGRYEPIIEAQLRDARDRLRALFPRGFELVFDNYNALVFGFAATDRSSDAFISIAGYPRWVTLFFLRGVDLVDPGELLEGSGKQVRSIRLKSAPDVDLADVQDLIAQAMRVHASELLAAPPLSTIVKMAMSEQRSRRPAPASRKRS